MSNQHQGSGGGRPSGRVTYGFEQPRTGRGGGGGGGVIPGISLLSTCATTEDPLSPSFSDAATDALTSSLTLPESFQLEVARRDAIFVNPTLAPVPGSSPATLLNPDIQSKTLKFDSYFESGNLGVVELVGRKAGLKSRGSREREEFNLYLQEDPFTKGAHWFFFRINNINKKSYQFNICNISNLGYDKRTSLFSGVSPFSQGLKPVVISEKAFQLRRLGWKHVDGECFFFPTPDAFRRPASSINGSNTIDGRKGEMYTLSFTLEVEYTKDTIFIAAAIPYSYTQLQLSIATLMHSAAYDSDPSSRGNKGSVILTKELCRTSCGNRCDVVCISEDLPETASTVMMVAGDSLNVALGSSAIELNTATDNGTKATKIDISAPQQQQNVSINDESAHSAAVDHEIEKVINAIQEKAFNSSNNKNSKGNSNSNSNSNSTDQCSRVNTGDHPNIIKMRSGTAEDGQARAKSRGGTPAPASRTAPRSIKPAVVIVARSEPNDTHASYVCEGLLQFLCSQDRRAVALRRKVEFVVVPMLNPDGVVCGRSSSNKEGFELARHWGSPDEILHAPVYHCKKMLADLNRRNRLLAFIEIRGNSFKENASFLGSRWSKALTLPEVFDKLKQNHPAPQSNVAQKIDDSIFSDDSIANAGIDSLGLRFDSAQLSPSNLALSRESASARRPNIATISLRDSDPRLLAFVMARRTQLVDLERCSFTEGVRYSDTNHNRSSTVINTNRQPEISINPSGSVSCARVVVNNAFDLPLSMAFEVSLYKKVGVAGARVHIDTSEFLGLGASLCQGLADLYGIEIDQELALNSFYHDADGSGEEDFYRSFDNLSHIESLWSDASDVPFDQDPKYNHLYFAALLAANPVVLAPITSSHKQELDLVVEARSIVRKTANPNEKVQVDNDESKSEDEGLAKTCRDIDSTGEDSKSNIGKEQRPPSQQTQQRPPPSHHLDHTVLTESFSIISLGPRMELRPVSTNAPGDANRRYRIKTPVLAPLEYPPPEINIDDASHLLRDINVPSLKLVQRQKIEEKNHSLLLQAKGSRAGSPSRAESSSNHFESIDFPGNIKPSTLSPTHPNLQHLKTFGYLSPRNKKDQTIKSSSAAMSPDEGDKGRFETDARIKMQFVRSSQNGGLAGKALGSKKGGVWFSLDATVSSGVASNTGLSCSEKENNCLSGNFVHGDDARIIAPTNELQRNCYEYDINCEWVDDSPSFFNNDSSDRGSVIHELIGDEIIDLQSRIVGQNAQIERMVQKRFVRDIDFTVVLHCLINKKIDDLAKMKSDETKPGDAQSDNGLCNLTLKGAAKEPVKRLKDRSRAKFRRKGREQDNGVMAEVAEHLAIELKQLAQKRQNSAASAAVLSRWIDIERLGGYSESREGFSTYKPKPPAKSKTKTKNENLNPNPNPIDLSNIYKFGTRIIMESGANLDLKFDVNRFGQQGDKLSPNQERARSSSPSSTLRAAIPVAVVNIPLDDDIDDDDLQDSTKDDALYKERMREIAPSLSLLSSGGNKTASARLGSPSSDPENVRTRNFDIATVAPIPASLTPPIIKYYRPFAPVPPNGMPIKSLEVDRSRSKQVVVNQATSSKDVSLSTKYTATLISHKPEPTNKVPTGDSVGIPIAKPPEMPRSSHSSQFSNKGRLILDDYFHGTSGAQANMSSNDSYLQLGTNISSSTPNAPSKGSGLGLGDFERISPTPSVAARGASSANIPNPEVQWALNFDNDSSSIGSSICGGGGCNQNQAVPKMILDAIQNQVKRKKKSPRSGFNN